MMESFSFREVTSSPRVEGAYGGRLLFPGAFLSLLESIREGYHSFLALNSFVSLFVLAIEFVLLKKFDSETSLIYERYLFREVERRRRLLRVFRRMMARSNRTVARRSNENQ